MNTALAAIHFLWLIVNRILLVSHSLHIPVSYFYLQCFFGGNGTWGTREVPFLWIKIYFLRYSRPKKKSNYTTIFHDKLKILVLIISRNSYSLFTWIFGDWKQSIPDMTCLVSDCFCCLFSAFLLTVKWFGHTQRALVLKIFPMFCEAANVT